MGLLRNVEEGFWIPFWDGQSSPRRSSSSERSGLEVAQVRRPVSHFSPVGGSPCSFHLTGDVLKDFNL